MADKWSAKVNVYTGADAGAATLGTLAAAGAQLRTNTDLIWANQPLRVYANNDVIQSVVGPQGGLYRMVSDATLALWGGYSDQDALISLSRADQGEPVGHIIQLAATSDNWIYAGHVFIDANAASTGAAGSYNAQVQLLANNATKAIEIQSRIGTEVGAFISMLTISTQSEAFNFRISDEGGVVTQFSPLVLNGPAALAYIFNTSAALVDDQAKLVSIQNNDVDQVIISRNGGISIGPNTLAYYSALAVDGRILLSARNVAVGDPDKNGIALAVENGANGSIFDVTLTQNSILYSLFVDVGLGSCGMQFTAGAASATQTLLINGNTVTKLEPSVADGVTAIAYLFDTSNSLVNAAARVVEFRNVGNAVFSVTPSGAALVGGGSVTLPSYSFIGDPNTGMWNPGADQLDFTVGGTDRLQITTTAIEGRLQFTSTVGTVAAPAFSFFTDEDTGMYRSAANTIGFSTGGTARLLIASTQLSISDAVNILIGTTTGTKIGTTTTQKISFWNATPVVQPTNVANPTGGGTIDTEARTAIDAILLRLEAIGLFA